MTTLKSNIEWKLWGTEDPLYGVASWDNRQKGAESEWTDDAFYELGESDWQDFIPHWQRYGVDNASCLEVGCGAGRITRQLALFFGQVYAVDVSEGMIDYARRHVQAGNVEYSVIDGLSVPQKTRSVKAIFSTHVLQHLDNVDVGLSYFREFFRVLDHGGTLMVHLPLYQWPRETGKVERIFRGVNGVLNQLCDMKAFIGRKRGVTFLRQTAYPLSVVHSQLRETGFKNVEFQTFPTRSTGHLHSFVLATK